MGLYIYGVTRASTTVPTGLCGVGDPPAAVRALAVGSLAAVVGEAPEKLRARRRDVQAHQTVLLELAATAPVLAARFGVVADDEESLRTRLERDADGYLAALERVTGRVEMNLKVEVVDEGLADLVREDETVRRLRRESLRNPGYDVSVRLGEAVVSGLRRRAAAVSAEALARLSDLAEAAQQGPEVDGCVANVSFLVDLAQVPRMRAVVGEIATGAGSRAALRLTGPLPCYSFSELPAGATV